MLHSEWPFFLLINICKNQENIIYLSNMRKTLYKLHCITWILLHHFVILQFPSTLKYHNYDDMGKNINYYIFSLTLPENANSRENICSCYLILTISAISEKGFIHKCHTVFNIFPAALSFFKLHNSLHPYIS